MDTCRVIFVSLSLVILVLSTRVPGTAQDRPLRIYADERGFLIGTAVAMTPFRSESIYNETLKNEFNILVAENAFKWDSVRPSRDTFNFADTDALVDFAEANHMKIRGHTLVWHSQIPSWLSGGNFTRDEVISILREHILTIVGRYRGRVWAWDVVNEAVNDSSGALRTSSFWFQTIGPDYIKLAFEYARDGDPDARLYYNDYSIEDLGAKSTGVYNLMSSLKSQGAPIDGVGWQMHQINGFRTDPAHKTNAKRLAGLGLEISITEMDVRMSLPSAPDDLNQQSIAYRDAINFCLTTPNCTALLTWGFTDKHSWIPGFFAGWGDALIFDSSYQPKPAYFALRDALIQGADSAPAISGAQRDRKKLLINGGGFLEGAEFFINGEKQKKVLNSLESPSVTLVAKKSGKKVRTGDILLVKNPDGLFSNEFVYSH
jgi:endo-1,4-beta-xylanase